MNLSRRGFLAALVAVPVAAKAITLRALEAVVVEQPFDPWLACEIQGLARVSFAEWLSARMDELMFNYASGNVRLPRLSLAERERIRSAFERLAAVELYAGEQWQST